MKNLRVAAGLSGIAMVLGCASRPAGPIPAPLAQPDGGPGPPESAPSTGRFPPVPVVTGPLRINVVYPTPTDQVDARDSTFLFGSLGTGDATLTVDGQPARVWPNGAWLAWIAMPADSVLNLTLTARTRLDSATLVYSIRRTRRFEPPNAAAWIDTTSLTPASRAWWPADEFLPVALRAAPGAVVRLVLPGGAVVPLVPDPAPGEVPWGIRAFDRDTGNLVVRTQADRYVGAIRGVAVGDPPGPFIGPAGNGQSCCSAEPPNRRAAEPPSGTVTVEAIVGADTARASWPLRLALLDSFPRMVELNDDTAGTGTTDSLTVGRARPGATYHWFFPTGTRAVATGRLGADLRIRLSENQQAWIPAADAIPLPVGTPATRGTAQSLTITSLSDRLVLRIPVTQRVPFRVEETAGTLTIRLYNTVSDVNWTRYGPTDPYLRDVRWLQATGDEVTVTLTLAGPVWGYRTRWSQNDLMFEVRRPPTIDPHRPLQGKLVVLDPGHPPLGATGPTGLRESTANFDVSLILSDLLAEAGARVILTRTAEQSLDLWPRIKLADSVSADLLVSVHNNGLPDGVNPFTNNGASVFYNHPRSLPLAQAIQAALVRRLGVRDLGAARGDLALTRPTWMPAVLTEGLFMMIPDQEATLRHPEGQRLYALAVRDGLVAFLKRVATGQARDVP
jgi:N-acetylmuramoyl-L-alanine amidase